jgi:hypothetical protein
LLTFATATDFTQVSLAKGHFTGFAISLNGSVRFFFGQKVVVKLGVALFRSHSSHGFPSDKKFQNKINFAFIGS